MARHSQLPLSPDERAKHLLLQVLSPEERLNYRAQLRREVTITGSEGGRYKVRMGSYSGNIVPLTPVWIGPVYRRRRAGPSNTLCAHPRLDLYNQNGAWRGRMPAMDAIVTQVLTIKADEKHFLRTALLYL